MRDYEVVYIFRSTLGTEDIESRVSGYHEKILATTDAAITAVVHWGKRELAYPIDKDRNGYYVVAQFTAPPEALPPFERALKLDDDLLRHLVVISEGELATVPPEDEGPRRRERSDDDDDERPRRKPSDDDDERPRRKPSEDDDAPDDSSADDADDASDEAAGDADDAGDADAADDADEADDAGETDDADDDAAAVEEED